MSASRGTRALGEGGICLLILLSTLPVTLAAQILPASSAGATAAMASSQPFDLKSPVERASFDLHHPNLHSLYDAIAQSFQIRLLYDPDLGEVPVSGDFRLQDVSLKEALEAAGSISRTFVAPVDPSTGIVAADTPDKRGEYERQVLGSFHLDDQLTPQQLTDISTALRTIVDLRRVSQDNRTNWITVVGRTHQVAVARQFVESLDKPTGEVMLDIEAWELNLNRAREWGLSAPQPFVLQFLGKDPKNPAIPLLEWGQVQTLYAVQIPGLTAFLNSSDSLVRFHQQLQLRASDGQEARLLVGERLPVILGDVNSVVLAGVDSSQSGTSQGFIPNIQYQDVGVVVHATPRLHAGGEITLQLDFALRQVKATGEGGRPTFTNRQMTSQFRLANDEAYLLGGIMENDQRTGVTGYPWLSQIPLIGWLFGNRRRSSTDTELLIMVRPTILRAPPAEEFASRSIYFGKELTGLPAPVAVPTPQPPRQPGAAPGVPVPGQTSQPGAAPVPGQQPQPGTVPVPGQQLQPGTAPTPGQPPQPGATAPAPAQQPRPGTAPFPGQLPQGVPFPGSAFPQGIGVGPGGAPQPRRPTQPQTNPSNPP